MKDFSAQKFIRQKRSPLFKVNIVLLMMVCALAVWQAWQANNQASYGQGLSDLQQQQDNLTHDVANLQQQVTALSSLSYISQYATTKLGMRPVGKDVRYLALPGE